MVAIDAGAEDIALDDDVYEILCEPTDLTAVRESLESGGIEIETAEIAQLPEDPRPARRGRRQQAAAAHRRARGPGRRRHRPRQLRRRRRRPGARRRQASGGSPARTRRLGLVAVLAVPDRADGDRLRRSMWLGVPIGLIYAASKLVDSPQPSMGPYLLILFGVPLGMTIIGKGLGALDRYYVRKTGARRRQAAQAAG